MNKNSKNNISYLRKSIFDILGNECVCCKEKMQQFLVIDHINRGGNDHRELLTGAEYLKSILNDPKIKEKYRTLCHNCNWAYNVFELCPHQNADAKRQVRKTKDPMCKKITWNITASYIERTQILDIARSISKKRGERLEDYIVNEVKKYYEKHKGVLNG